MLSTNNNNNNKNKNKKKKKKKKKKKRSKHHNIVTSEAMASVSCVLWAEKLRL